MKLKGKPKSSITEFEFESSKPIPLGEKKFTVGLGNGLKRDALTTGCPLILGLDQVWLGWRNVRERKDAAQW